MFQTKTDDNNTMALPLQLFMKDLLLDRASCSENPVCELVVDNARTPHNSTPERELSRLLRRQRRRWEIQCQEEAQRQQQRSKKDVLDISDHSKKDSRWVSSMSRDHQTSSPTTPARPLQAEPKSLQPIFANWDVGSEKDTAPRAYRHGRVSDQTMDQTRLKRNANTIKNVDEAIAICSISSA
jgi:hypothetical protein